MGNQPKTFTTVGIVLKRTNGKETDRIVTILTQDYGKIVAVAKGVRKMNSTKRAFLEPGMVIKGHFVNTKGLPLLTQIQVEQEYASLRAELPKIRSLSQILEIIDALFVEEEIDIAVYNEVISLLDRIAHNQTGYVRAQLGQLIENLGYQHPGQTKHVNISDYISEITGRKLNSFEFLKI